MLNEHYPSSAVIYREWIVAEKAKSGKVGDSDSRYVMITRHRITKIAAIEEIIPWIISPWDFWNVVDNKNIPFAHKLLGLRRTGMHYKVFLCEYVYKIYI
jgi:hypothetical protein